MPGERRRRGHGVGRPDDRAEHERRLPAHPRHDRVRHDGDGGHRGEHEPDREQGERPDARLSSRGELSQPAACSSGGRKTRKTTSGSSSRSGSASTKPIASPPTHEHDRVGDRDQVGQPDEHRRGGQQQDQVLDVAHGARNLGRATTLGSARGARPAHPTARTGRPRRRTGRRAAGARHVRRLPVPVLHRRAADPRPRAHAARRPPAVRLPPLPAAHHPPRRGARRRGRRGGRRAGRVLAMHDALYGQRGKLGEDDIVRAAARAGLDGARIRAELRAGDARRARPGGRRERRRGRRERHADVLRQRRPPRRARSTPSR